MDNYFVVFESASCCIQTSVEVSRYLEGFDSARRTFLMRKVSSVSLTDEKGLELTFKCEENKIAVFQYVALDSLGDGRRVVVLRSVREGTLIPPHKSGGGRILRGIRHLYYATGLAHIIAIATTWMKDSLGG